MLYSHYRTKGLEKVDRRGDTTVGKKVYKKEDVEEKERAAL